MTDFRQFKIIAEQAVLEVDTLLRDKLSDDPHMIKEQISDIETHHHRLTNLICDADEILSAAEMNVLDTLGNDMTKAYREIDKKIIIKAGSRAERRVRDLVELKLKDIDKRIEAGQSLLAFYREIYKKGEQ